MACYRHNNTILCMGNMCPDEIAWTISACDMDADQLESSFAIVVAYVHDVTNDVYAYHVKCLYELYIEIATRIAPLIFLLTTHTNTI